MTTIETTAYVPIAAQWPQAGNHSMAYQQSDTLVVYQAYKNSIAQYAVDNQQLGGPEFSYGRMSWIKPNFLWMMYRCGWAAKPNQESVLAIWLHKKNFESILEEAVLSSYNPAFNNNHEEWKAELESRDVRLQWDPDHDPFGKKLERRALQLGLKGTMLEKFGRQYIIKIEDVTSFVQTQKAILDKHGISELLVPAESEFTPSLPSLIKKLGLLQYQI